MIEPELKHRQADPRDTASVHYPKAHSKSQFQPRMLPTLFRGAVV